MSNHSKSRGRSRWRRLSKEALVTLIILGGLLVAARIALPYLVEHYVNKKLDEVPTYDGKIEDVDISLWRGAYQIHGIEIVTEEGNVPVPFFAAQSIDISLQWKELFHGSIVGEILLVEPSLNFVAGPTQEQSQTGKDQAWGATLEKLSPFRVNKFEIEKGKVRFLDEHSDPKVDVALYELSAVATNLTNVRDLTNALPAALDASGKVWGDGLFELHLQINALADQPNFKLAAALTNIDLVALNDFMRAYAKVDVASGKFSMFTEMAAADGRYDGYVKPFFDDLDVFAWDQERKDNFLKAFWEAIVGGVTTAFENQPKKQLATRIPISGATDQPSVNILATIGNLLRHAFVKALVPKFDQTVMSPDHEKKVESDAPLK